VVEIFRISCGASSEEEKVSILLVEQNAALALDLAGHPLTSSRPAGS